jgi:anaerobic magnesium-protoporphyrin IX monomethyl ester cyclase
MKIVLVHSAQKAWTKAALIPLGVGYIASYLEKNGFSDVKIIDYSVEPNAKLPKADVVGISATTASIKSAWKIAKRAKKMGAFTVIGGPHVSALPEETMNLPYVDFVCVGEGEETMLEICRTLQSGKKSFEKIKGISYKKQGKVYINKPRPLISNLDSLPFPAYHLFKLPLYTSAQPLISVRKPVANLITSRGCPFGCNFCFKGIFGRIWRPRSVESVLDEWEYLVKVVKVSEISLMDDAFNIDMERALEICKEIKKRNLIIPWRSASGIRADRSSKKLLKAMKVAGCYHLAFGVESGVQKVLNEIIHKQLKLSSVRKAFGICRELGITSWAFFMIGNIGETLEDVQKTINFAIKLDPDFAQFTVATPFPGTLLYQLVKNNSKLKELDWDKFYMFGNRGYFNNSLKAEDIARLTTRAYRKFYLRPKVVFRLLKRKQTYLALPNVISGAFHYFFNYNY